MEQFLLNNLPRGTVISEVNSVDHFYTDGSSVGACFRVGIHLEYVYVYPDGSAWGTGPNVNKVREWIAKYGSNLTETKKDSPFQSTLQDRQLAHQ
jgi:hypothetical protein